MRSRRGLKRPIALLVVFVLAMSVLAMTSVADPVPKRIQGQVDPNPDTNVAFPGVSTFYIQNRTDEGQDVDVMNTAGVEYYDQAIEDSITNWDVGDPGVVIVDVEHGTYGTNDRAGYVAYATDILDGTGSQVFPTVVLQKIPTAQFEANGTGFINVSWSALPDPDGLIAGYKVYRSTTNASDLDWTLVGGSVNAPLTDMWYNDTSVTEGMTYYYSVKVCFIGYQGNNPLNVDNYQNMYFGEGSIPIMAPLSGLTIDYVNLTTGATPNGPLLDNDALNVGDSIQIWASGFSTSTNPHPYVAPVVVDWSHSDPTLGSFSTLNGDNTMYTAGYYHMGGTDTITGDDGGGMVDTGDIIVNAPTVDYIILTDTPNGTALSNVVLEVGQSVTAYASGYNATAGTYVALVTVTWADTGENLGNINPASGTSTTFDATSAGLTNLTGTSGMLFDDFALFINPAPLTVDNIKIVDTGATGTTEIPDQTVDIDTTIRGYAAAFNGTTYMYDVAVDWDVIVTTENATTLPMMGSDWSDFYSGWIEGTVTWTADYGGGMTDTVVFTINPPQVDYIEIVDIAGGVGETPIPDHTLNVGDTVTGYAASYNLVTGYLGDIAVNWSVTNASGATASTLPLTGVDSSVFSAGMTGGQATWTADDGMGHTDSVIIDINAPTVDHIMIVDTEGTGVTEIDDQTVDGGFVILAWAASYNDTAGYIGDISVTWALENSSAPSSFITPLSGMNTTFTSGTEDGVVNLTADDGAGHNDTVVFTIEIIYTIDYITIVDTQDTGLAEITDQTVPVGFSIAGYAASFNHTGGYLGDVSVEWSVDTVGTTTPGSGLTSTFNSGLGLAGGTATWTADYMTGTFTDTVEFTVQEPTEDYIQIEDKEDGTGDEIGDVSITVGTLSDQWYCVAYNVTAGVLGVRSATWSIIGDDIGTVSQGTFTTFNATTVGNGTVTAAFEGLTDATGTITVTIPGDTTPPAAPTDLVVSQVAAGGALNLGWTANTEMDFAGYNVYRSTSATGTFTALNTALLTSNSYSDTTVTEGTTYYYYVTAVDESDNESPGSTTASNTADRDTDGDGIFNLQDDDDDGDTLTDAEEAALGTDPLDPDSDDDGYNDAEDEDPLDPTIPGDGDDDDDEDEFPIWIIIIIIVVIVLILLLVMMRKGKEAPAPPPEAPEEEVPPPEEEVPPPEEEMPEEEEPPLEEEAPPEEEPPIEEEEPPTEEEAPPSDEPAPPSEPEEPAPPSEDEFPPPP
jgi:hypothetical protein